MSSKHGYSGYVANLLERLGAGVGDEVLVEKNGLQLRGFVMARYEFGEPGVLVLKLDNGYNVGVKIDPSTKVSKLSSAAVPAFKPPPPPQPSQNLPKVAIVNTGGTIASRIDYRTGGVKPALSASDLVSIVPEIAEIANVSAEILMQVVSENMTPKHWTTIAQRVNTLFNEGFDGIVITHGTDTMGYTAAALSFALQNPPVPVVLVGAQRSSDRPSSDAAKNLIAAVETAAKAPFAEVVVCMHGWHSDEEIFIHRGTRVVKFHTSSRGAFQSINATPIAVHTQRGIEIIDDRHHSRGWDSYRYHPNFDDRAMLVKFTPGMHPQTLEILAEKMNLRGLILEGTGLGHVASSFIPVLKRLTDSGMFVGMTSQCRFGRVNMNVYENGRDLLRAGVTPLDNMLAETALVKLMWVLGFLGEKAQLDEVRNLMARNLCGEIGGRTRPQPTFHGDELHGL
ncbi:MAG: Glu-tRNA(Gln) amidotransferase subunit GatD [Candidatus Caldarchaeum sp.]|nr:Glu-tRNA(Gln) amidotransferase subunit GatD [Candidatus Caldarchaeum sp.]MDW8434679.1 Glu-tRNA(Gln) amidotransferase subunit GatD [Candidatus Caldarchaeum sp.]